MQKTINSSENKQDKQNKGPIARPSEVHFQEITHPNLDCGQLYVNDRSRLTLVLKSMNIFTRPKFFAFSS